MLLFARKRYKQSLDPQNLVLFEKFCEMLANSLHNQQTILTNRLTILNKNILRNKGNKTTKLLI